MMLSKRKLHESLGAYLRDKRVEAGFTQAEVAQRLGYSSAQLISNIERGLCAPPMKSLKRLVSLLSLPGEELLELFMAEHEKALRQHIFGPTKAKTRRSRNRAN
jgi:transcriptional regulator with XRE-family HTH domain